MINFRLNFGSWLLSIRLCRRSECRFLKVNGIDYMLQPQMQQPTRVSIFKVLKNKDEYLCAVGYESSNKKWSRNFPLNIPLEVHRAAIRFSQSLEIDCQKRKRAA